MKLTFSFFKRNNRLYVRLNEFGIIKPAESKAGKRYNIAKVLGLAFSFGYMITDGDICRLQNGKDGDIIEIEV